MADEQTTSQTTQDAKEAASAVNEVNDTPEQESHVQGVAEGTEKTFTQTELNKIIADRLKSEQKRWEKKAADEKAEAERVAAMTADEKSKHEREKQEKALADREAALTKRERTALAKEFLAEKNVPAVLVGAVDISDPDGIEASAAAVAKAFSEAVSAEVAKKLAGAPPKKGVSGAKDPFLEGLGI
ncbi:MAG: DUF4355 domain-containing protein [Ruminococcaceae bacterium]|nr:DUF4355 domain-containing protein [Oscillospiraceae bacterium]